MFKINDKILLNLAENFTTYQRGLVYAFQNKVKNFKFDDLSLTINALVMGSKNYNVEIAFSKYGEVDDAFCTCPSYWNNNGCCKHIIAVLKKAQQELSIFEKILSSRHQHNNDIFNFIETLQQRNVKTELILDITYTASTTEFYHGVPLGSISLRIGESRLYSIKSIKKFFEGLEEDRVIEFGKNFTFYPSIHTFKEQDQQIIDLLRQIYETEKITEELHYLYQPKSVFKGKSVYLSPTSVHKLFSLLTYKDITVNILGRDYENVRIIEKDLPLDFTITQDQQDLLLELKSKEVLLPLTPKGEYFFTKGHIYHLSKQQQKYFAPFFHALQNPRKEIRFSNKDKERFVSELLPIVRNIGVVEIEHQVEETFHEASLRIEVYFDKNEDEISARVKFIYDDVSIDPFSAQQTYHGDKILIRDIEKERAILDIFEQAEFKVLEGKLYLRDDEKIFSFIYTLLPILQENAEIFYSDTFKNIRIKDPRAFTGGIRLNEGSDMLEFSFHHEEIAHSELKFILSSLKEKKKYHRLKDGSFIPLDSDTLKHISELVDYLDLSDKDLDKKMIELPKFRAVYLENKLKENKTFRAEKNLAFKQLVQNINEPQDMDFQPPLELQSVLREYQKTGFKWLKTLSMYGLGGILADDMGLGKTLQTIAFIASEKSNGLGPSLIVAPTSLVYNWEEEVQKFAPSLRTLIISGTQNERAVQLQEVEKADLVITSYPLIRRDIELYENFRFAYCFLDEAQHIKNASSQNSKSVKQIKARGFFALTGTPIENSLTELWSIFDFIMPGYLLTHTKFSRKYEKPIIKEQNPNVLGELSKQISPFILRRLKKDVLKELPPKIESKMTAELLEDQKKLYLAYLQEAKGEIAKELSSNGFEKSQMKILAALTRLRQICCHPSMFLENYESTSGKMQLLQEVIEDALESGHRILLFSQFTSMLGIIKNYLSKQNISYFYLDGSVKAEKRKEMVKNFNKGEGEIFLISLKAGGTGLNLVGADMVIHYDPWWNPAVEEQATDRAYRIGQTNVVQVIKLITQGTIEEKIYALQEKKKQMIESIIQPGETFLSQMNEEEIKKLFDL